MVPRGQAKRDGTSVFIGDITSKGRSEPAPTSAPWRMDGEWSGNSFLFGSSSLANHG
jgi:hypothetical protein